MNELPMEIRQLILDFTTLPALTMLGSTNTAYKNEVTSHMLQRVHQLLRVFALEPRPFLQMLSDTNSIISGSAALLIVLTWSFTPNDLDIYTPVSRAGEVVEILKNDFGYEDEKTKEVTDGEENEMLIDNDNGMVIDGNDEGNEQTTNNEDDELPANNNMDDLPDVYADCHSVITLYKGYRKVQVVVSTTEDATKPVRGFHSSPVMNFISGQGIYCAYPILTGAYRGILNRNSVAWNAQLRLETEACINKYRARGFMMEDDLSQWADFKGHICGRIGSCPSTRRGLNDKYILYRKVPLSEDTFNPEQAYRTQDVDNVWQMKRRICMY